MTCIERTPRAFPLFFDSALPSEVLATLQRHVAALLGMMVSLYTNPDWGSKTMAAVLSAAELSSCSPGHLPLLTSQSR